MPAAARRTDKPSSVCNLVGRRNVCSLDGDCNKTMTQGQSFRNTEEGTITSNSDSGKKRQMRELGSKDFLVSPRKTLFSGKGMNWMLRQEGERLSHGILCSQTL